MRTPIIIAILIGIFAIAPAVNAVECDNGMVQAPPEVRALNSKIPTCVMPSDLELFKREGFQDAGQALEYLKTKVCPGKQVGYNSNIAPSQLKEQYVYFSYPNQSGESSMSPSALVCFQKAVKAMEAAGLQPCIAAALRSPMHQDASCKDSRNSIVCGRTSGGGCRGEYGSCPHVVGRAMDFNNKNGNTSADWYGKMRQAAATAGAYPAKGAPNDLPHLECNGAAPSNVPNNGIVGPPTNTPTSPSPQSVLSSLGQFFSPPPPQQCAPGMILLNGQCLPNQAQQATQTTSPYSYAQPQSSNLGTGSTIGSSVNTNGTQSGVGTDIGSGVNISGLLGGSSETKTGTTTAAIDLISAIANPTSSQPTSTSIGQPIYLNGSLVNTSALSGSPASSSALSPGSIYQINPSAPQTFVSQDLSKNPVGPYRAAPVTTFQLLENLRQVLTTILMMLRPFGGVVPQGTNSSVAVLR